MSSDRRNPEKVISSLIASQRRPARSPRGWWQGSEGRERARAETRHMLRELGWSTLDGADIAKRTTYRIFTEHGLGKMLDIVYGSSPYAALHDLFPALHPWQMKQTPNRYWQGEEGREHAQAATRWMTEQLGLAGADPAKIAAWVDQSTFDLMGLRGMLEIVYGDSPYEALSDLYPDLYPWQMVGGTSTAYWKGKSGREHGRLATRWMIAQLGLEGLEPGDVGQYVTSKTFEAHGLMGMLAIVYGDSPYAALKDVYSDLQPWQMARAPRSYRSGAISGKYVHTATRWMIAQLELQDADPIMVASLINNGTLDPVHMAVMLGHVYEGSSDKALDDPSSLLYPLWIAREPWWMSGEAGSRLHSHLVTARGGVGE